MAEEMMIRGMTVSSVEFDALGELFRLRSTRAGQMPIFENGEMKRILEPGVEGSMLVRIDGIIQWWPPALRSALPEWAEVFTAAEGTPQWLPAGNALGGVDG